MIAVGGHFEKGFDFERHDNEDDADDYWRFLDLECRSLIDTMEGGYGLFDDMDLDVAIDGLAESTEAIDSLEYQIREYSIRYFKSEVETKQMLEIDLSAEVMPVDEFKQVSCNAAFQLATRILNVIELELWVEDQPSEPELYEMEEFDNKILETPMDIEKAAYLAILKSELDRVYLNAVMAGNSDEAVLIWRNQEKLKKARQIGASKTNAFWAPLKREAVKLAKNEWSKNPQIRMRAMADIVTADIHKRYPKKSRPPNFKVPELNTVRGWIKVIAPAEARKPGAPKK